MDERTEPLGGDDFGWTEPDRDLSINEQLIIHTRMHQVADYYLIERLKDVALEKFTSTAGGGVDTGSFTDVIKAVYALTGASGARLRDALPHVVYNNIDDLLAADILGQLTLDGRSDVMNFQSDLVLVMATQQSIELHARQSLNQRVSELAAELREALEQSNKKARDAQNFERVVHRLQPCQRQRCCQRFSYI